MTTATRYALADHAVYFGDNGRALCLDAGASLSVSLRGQRVCRA